MDKGRIYKMLKHLNSKPETVQNREGWVISSCVYAPWKHQDGVDKNPSFGVSIVEGGVSRHHCFSCGSGGDLMDMVFEIKRNQALHPVDGYELKKPINLIMKEAEKAELNTPDYPEPGATARNLKIYTWPEFYVNGLLHALDFKIPRKYLKGRDVPKKVSKKLGLRYDQAAGRVVFPIRDWNGKLVGLHGRNMAKDAPYPYHAYRCEGRINKVPWLGEENIDPSKPIVLVESVFDLASVYRVYTNVLASLSAGMSKAKVKRVGGFHEIVTFYDYGKGGDAARATLDKYIDGAFMVHVIPTEIQDDPGAMTAKEIRVALGAYVQLDV